LGCTRRLKRRMARLLYNFQSITIKVSITMEFELSFGFGMGKGMIMKKLEGRTSNLLAGLAHKISTGEDVPRDST
jgi:hypothetical protein